MTVRTFGMEALIRAVPDGDTPYGWVDQGIGVWNYGLSKNGMGLRLDGLNAREKDDAGGIEARDYLRTLLPIGSVWPIVCTGWDKYAGRLDVRIALPTIGDLSEHLIAEGWAARWNGKGPRPLPAWPRVTA